MSKHLSFWVAVLLSFQFSYAQKYWDPAEYPEWDAVADNYLVSFDPTTTYVTGLNGLTDFTKDFLTIQAYGDLDEGIWYSDNNENVLTGSGDELHVVFTRAVGDTNKYSSFTIDFAKWGNAKPSETSIDMSNYYRKGFVADLRSNFKITGEIYIPANFPIPSYRTGFAIRASVIDAHGHEWNEGGDCVDTIRESEFGTWTTFTIDYPLLASQSTLTSGWQYDQHGDGWSDDFNKMPRPIDKFYWFDKAPMAPIDTANITGGRFYFMPGQNEDFDATIKLRNIQFGDGSTTLDYQPDVFESKLEIVETIDPIILEKGYSEKIIDISNVFASNEDFTVVATTSGDDIASVQTTNEYVTVSENSIPETGIFTVTVTATSVSNLEKSVDVEITVKEAPDRYWVASEYPEWDAISENYVVSISATETDKVKGLNGLTNFTNPDITIQNFTDPDKGIWSTNNNDHVLSSSGDELLIDYLRYSTNTNRYPSFRVDLSKWIGEEPTETSTTMSDYTLGGYIVDMRDNFVISGEIFIPSTVAYDLTLRASVLDAHGHEWNEGGHAIDTILDTEFGSWVSFTVDYPAISQSQSGGWEYLQHGDGWNDYFNNMPRPIDKFDWMDKAPVAPIDTANISAIKFYFFPGKNVDVEAQFKMRNITIGDGSVAFEPSNEFVPRLSVSEPILDQEYVQDFEADTLIITDLFSSNEDYTVSVISSDTDVALVKIDGDKLIINPGTVIGESTISITAKSASNLEETTSFKVSVQSHVLTIEYSLDNVLLTQGFLTEVLNITGLFLSDEDITITVESSNTDVVSVGVLGDVITLTEGTAIEQSVIDVIAETTSGLKDTVSFTVMVEEAPVVVEKYWVPSEFPAWDAIAEDYLVSFSEDETIFVNGLKGITDFESTNIPLRNKGEDTEAVWFTDATCYTLSGEGNELHVDFDRGFDDGSLYGSFGIDFAKWIGDKPSATSTHMGDYERGGYIVDMRENFVIKGEVFVSTTLTDEVGSVFTLRSSVYDAHGHEWNEGGDAFDWIDEADFGTWVPFSIDYPALQAAYENEPLGGWYLDDHGDAYSEDFNGMPRPITGGTNSSDYAPIDTAHIAGLRFYFEPGGDDDMSGIVKLRNIEIGDGSAVFINGDVEEYIIGTSVPHQVVYSENAGILEESIVEFFTSNTSYTVTAISSNETVLGVSVNDTETALEYNITGEIGTSTISVIATAESGVADTIVYQFKVREKQDKYWNPEEYPAWDAVAENYLVSYSDTAIFTTGLSGLTDFESTGMLVSNIGPDEESVWFAGKSSYTLYGEGDELHVDFDRVDGDGLKYSSFGLDFSKWDEEEPTVESVFMDDYKRNGYIVDMRQDFVVSGEVFVPSTMDLNGNGALTLRTSVYDAHGHEWNEGGDAIDYIDETEFGSWVAFSVDYPALHGAYPDDYGWFLSQHGDAYGEYFNNMPRPISGGTNKSDFAPIDTAHITGVRFYLMPGHDETMSGLIKFRNITLGDGSTVFNGSTEPILKVAQGIENFELVEGFETNELDLKGLFTSNEPFTITATSSVETIATVSVEGTMLLITEQIEAGEVEITLTAESESGLLADTSFILTIEEFVPELIAPDGGAVEWTTADAGTAIDDIQGMFICNEPYTVEVKSSNTDVVAVSLDQFDLTTTITGVIGESILTFIATSESGLVDSVKYTFIVSAPPVAPAKYWNPEEYPAWDEVADNYLVSFSDTAVFVTGLSGLTDFETTSIVVSNGGPTEESVWFTGESSYTLLTEGNELHVDFDRTLGDAMLYSSFGLDFSKWDGAEPSEESTHMGDYKRNGYIADIRENFVVSGEVFVPSTMDLDGNGALSIRASVYDAHGHEWNEGGDAIDFVDESYFGEWVEFTIDYPALHAATPDDFGWFLPQHGDAYGTFFNGMPRPISGGSNDADFAPIDTAHITGVRFYLMPGHNETMSGTVKFRNITIGDGSTIFNNGIFDGEITPKLTVESQLSDYQFYVGFGSYDDLYVPKLFSSNEMFDFSITQSTDEFVTVSYDGGEMFFREVNGSVAGETEVTITATSESGLTESISFYVNIIAQPIVAEKYWVADEYPAWDEVADDYLASFSDDAQFVTGLSGLTDFEGTHMPISNDGANEESVWFTGESSYTLSSEGNELHVDFDRTIGDELLYSSFGLDFSKWDGSEPTIESTHMGDYARNGYIADIRENFVVTGEVFVPSSMDLDGNGSLSIRASVFDAHGHEWNEGGDAIDFVDESYFGEWVEFSIDYPALHANNPDDFGWFLSQHGDAYGEFFNGMPRPISGGSNDADFAPIDTAHITGVRFYLMPGHNETMSGTVKFRNISIGDGSTTFDNGEPVFVPKLSLVNPIASMDLEEGFVTRTIDVSDIFTSNESYTLAVSNSDPTVVSAQLVDNTLYITEKQISDWDNTEITVTAISESGLIEETSFFVSVEPYIEPIAKYWVPEEYPEWDNVADNYMVSYDTDSTWFVTGLSGLTDFSNGISIRNAGERTEGVWHTDQTGYDLSASGDELHINFSRTVEDESQYGNFGIDFATWIGDAPTATSTNMGDYNRGGYIVDMSDNFVISGEVFVPSTMDLNGNGALSLRASVYDAHGHEWNEGGDAIDFIDETEFGTWVSFEIDYPALHAANPDDYGWFHSQHGDYYGGAFNNMPRPVDAFVPIDTAHIAGLRFYLMPGHDETMSGLVKMRNLAIGDASIGYTPEEKPEELKEVVEVSSQIVDVEIEAGSGKTVISLTDVFTHADGAELEYTVTTSNPNVAEVSIEGGNVVVSEGILAGDATITVTATDSDGNSVSTEFIVTIEPQVNNAPEVVSAIPDQTFTEGFGTIRLNIDGVFTDVDGDDLLYSTQSSKTSVVKVAMSGSELVFTEGSSLSSSVITVTAIDPFGLSEQMTFAVSISSQPNTKPTVEATIHAQSLDAGFDVATVSLTSVFADADSDELFITAVSSNEMIVSTSIIGNSIILAEGNEAGLATITVFANDNKGGSVTTTFEVTVYEAVNNQPVVAFTIPDYSVESGFRTKTIDISDVFTDADELSIDAYTSDEIVVSLLLSETLLYVFDESIGTATITLVATDGKSASVSSTFDFEVTEPINEIPEVNEAIADQALEQGFGEYVIDLSSLFTDADGDKLNYTVETTNSSVVTGATKGSVLTLTEVGAGTAVITVYVKDENGGENESSFIVGINALGNDAPTVGVALGDTILSGETVYTIDLSSVFVDANGDELIITASSSDESVAVTNVVGSTLIVTFVAEESSASQFTLMADDGKGGIVSTSFFASFSLETSTVSLSENLFKVYPTLSDGLVTVFTPVNTEVSVTSQNGVVVYVTMLMASETQLDLTGLPTGMYYVSLNKETFTIIIQ